MFLGSCGSEPTQPPDPALPTGTVPVALEEVAAGLTFPLYLTSPPEDSRLFIVEKGGRIRIVKNGALLATPFLDISSQVSSGREQGLLGLAFDPNYASNGRFVVHYTDTQGDTRVSIFTVSADPDVANGSEQPILSLDQPFSNHNGGHLLFGPDGYLYVGLGDGGGVGDPDGRGQTVDDLFGSILRLDVSSGTSYSIPADNPFVDQPNASGELWSYGLRNPWRFSFDRGTGDLYIADVGQFAWEEVDVATAAQGAGRGVNYGWSTDGRPTLLPRRLVRPDRPHAAGQRIQPQFRLLDHRRPRLPRYRDPGTARTLFLCGLLQRLGAEFPLSEWCNRRTKPIGRRCGQVGQFQVSARTPRESCTSLTPREPSIASSDDLLALTAASGSTPATRQIRSTVSPILLFGVDAPAVIPIVRDAPAAIPPRPLPGVLRSAGAEWCPCRCRCTWRPRYDRSRSPSTGPAPRGDRYCSSCSRR